MPRIGIFGGTFDPIHIAHLYIAQKAIEIFHLSQIIFLPAADPPHKLKNSVTNFKYRYDMIALAIKENPKFSLSDLEKQILKDRSYTVNTLEKLHCIYPNHEIFFIIGADSLFSMDSWYKPHRLFQLATFICFDRYDEGLVTMEKQKEFLEEKFDAHILLVDIINLDISSTFIRRELHQNQGVHYLLPDSVLEYIHENAVYQKEKD